MHAACKFGLLLLRMLHGCGPGSVLHFSRICTLPSHLVLSSHLPFSCNSPPSTRCSPLSTLPTLQVRHLQQALVYTKGDKDVAAIKHVLASLTGEEGFEDEPVF